MDSANQGVPKPAIAAALAGIQAGVLGVLSMLAWLGLSAVWQRRGFWTAVNLMATYFTGDGHIPSGFTRTTMSGLALYVFVYGLLGMVFGAALATRARGLRLTLFGVMAALAWYYLSFGLLWRKLAPLVALLHAQRSTLLGHVLYGAMLGRAGLYLAKQEGGGAAPAPEPAGGPGI